jgi:hypothetical protein
MRTRTAASSHVNTGGSIEANNHYPHYKENHLPTQPFILWHVILCIHIINKMFVELKIPTHENLLCSNRKCMPKSEYTLIRQDP